MDEKKPNRIVAWFRRVFYYDYQQETKEEDSEAKYNIREVVNNFKETMNGLTEMKSNLEKKVEFVEELSKSMSKAAEIQEKSNEAYDGLNEAAKLAAASTEQLDKDMADVVKSVKKTSGKAKDTYAQSEENRNIFQEGVIKIGESYDPQMENVVDITKKVEETKKDPYTLALLTTKPKGEA